MNNAIILNFFPCFLPYLFTSLLIYFSDYRPVPFQGRRSYRRPNLALFFSLLCVVVYFCYGRMFAIVMLDLDFQYLAKRLAEKNVSKMTHFVSNEMQNLDSVN